MNLILALLASYLLGAIPFGFLLVKWRTGGDIRASGSGNIGATNVFRTNGLWAGVATLILDIGKGYLAVWLAGRLNAGDVLAMSASALAVMAGHAYPVFLGFHGGKAVATFVGAFLCISPLATAGALVVFLAMTAWTRHVSAGSVLAAGTFPLAAWIVAHPPWPVLAASVVAGAFVVYRHRENIERLHNGTESALSFSPQRR
ncbi:MAG: glycerol-3-phosphate 1-O-acyltransferase [Bryobacterales bacterium]|nr:glycerol-3-phosphate 1-O-acyltransferase [Bryobacterales bacterium]